MLHKVKHWCNHPFASAPLYWMDTRVDGGCEIGWQVNTLKTLCLKDCCKVRIMKIAYLCWSLNTLYCIYKYHWKHIIQLRLSVLSNLMVVWNSEPGCAWKICRERCARGLVHDDNVESCIIILRHMYSIVQSMCNSVPAIIYQVSHF